MFWKKKKPPKCELRVICNRFTLFYGPASSETLEGKAKEIEGHMRTGEPFQASGKAINPAIIELIVRDFPTPQETT